MEMKFEEFEAKTLEKLENMEKSENKTMEKLEKFETHIQNLETYGPSVENTAAKLAEDYKKMSSEEQEKFLESFTEQCQFSKTQTPEAGCSERAEYLAKAFKDPCQGDGCKNNQTMEKTTKRNICKDQKLKFAQWTQVMCSKMHNLEPKKKMGGCVKNGIELLFATTNKVRAQEFAKAPPGKSNLVLWTRVSPNLRNTLLRQIPKGFILTETMLGAVASQPGVEDFQGCSWWSQEHMWASNSASLIREMEGGSKVYFVSGIDLLQESQRPYGETVAFSLELPQLGKAASSVREAIIVNLHNGTNEDHLCAAVRAALSSEVPGLEANTIPLKKADCSHCVHQPHSACMVDCLGWSKTFNEEDLQKVLQEPETLWKLIQGAPPFASTFLKLVPELAGEKLLPELAGAKIEGVAPLLWAAQFGDEKVVEAFLKAGADTEAKDLGGWTPLHFAAWKGDEKMVEVLLKAGADIEAKMEYGGTPLHFAARNGHEKVVEVLLKAGADIEAKAKKGWTPLHFAAYHGHEKVVEVLLKAGADIEAKNKDGETPLHWAAWKGHEKVVEVLVKNGVQVNAKDKKGRTPLYWAAREDGFTPSRFAKQPGSEKVVEVLRKFGARSLELWEFPTSWYAEHGLVKVPGGDCAPGDSAVLAPFEAEGFSEGTRFSHGGGCFSSLFHTGDVIGSS
eukprot:symbB.v1.2.036615.t1/scaffold5208.1/size29809/2